VKYWPWSGMGEEVQGGWPILEKLVNFIVEKWGEILSCGVFRV